MGISYKPLWRILLERNMNKTQLRELASISTPTLARMGKDEYVSLEILERICEKLDCQIGDIVEYVPKEDEKK